MTLPTFIKLSKHIINLSHIVQISKIDCHTNAYRIYLTNVQCPLEITELKDKDDFHIINRIMRHLQYCQHD